MAEPAPAPCLRCGGFGQESPADPLGVRLCARCWTADLGRAPAPFRPFYGMPQASGLVVLAVAVMAESAHLGVLFSNPYGFPAVDLGAVAAFALLGGALAIALVQICRIVRMRGAIEPALGLDRARLRAALGGGAVIRRVLRATLLPGERYRFDLAYDAGLLAAGARGVVYFGTRERAALRWDEVEVARRGPLGSGLAISARGGPIVHLFINFEARADFLSPTNGTARFLAEIEALRGGAGSATIPE